MKELKEIKIEIGFQKKPKKIVNEIEQWSKKLKNEGWEFSCTKTDSLLREIILCFEREYRNET